MARVIAGMTISLDGFATDRDGSLGPLYPDFAALRGSDYMNDLAAETGAVLMGRRTFDMAGDPDSYADDYEFQVPIFVLTHHPPAKKPRENEHLTVSFVTDGLESAVAQAKEAAGDRNVTAVGGPGLTRDLLVTGLADELDIDVMPVFLGDGLRLFDDVALAGVRLEKIGIRDVGMRTNLRFRVLKGA